MVQTVAALVAAAGSAADPQEYGRQIERQVLPDLLPYTVGQPAAFTFAGRNGRALGDDAAGVMFSLVTNTGISTGLTSRDVAGTRSDSFPYVVPAGR